MVIAGKKDDMTYDAVEYYYSYGDAILLKVSNSDDLFGDAIKTVIDSKTAVPAKASAPDPGKKGTGKEEDKGEEEESSEEDDEDEKEAPHVEGENIEEDAPEDLQLAWER